MGGSFYKGAFCTPITVKAVANVDLAETSLAVYGHGKKVTPFYVAMVTYYDQITCPSEEGKVRDMRLTSVITYLLDKGVDPNIPISVKDYENGVFKDYYMFSSPLHIACTKVSNISMVTSLISHGSDVNNTNFKNEAPLMTALDTIDQAENIQEYLEVLDTLLTAGADPDKTLIKKYDTISPLRKSLEKDTRVMALLLKHGANVNALGEEMYVSIIMQLARYLRFSPQEQIEKLELVLDKAYNINIHQIPRKENFFHILCSSHLDNPAIVAVMLHKQPGLDKYINEPAFNNVLPLFYAVDYCNLEMAVALIEHGALANVLDEYSGRTIIERALVELDSISWLSQSNTNHALKHLPEFVETMFNKGLMSNVFHYFIWEDTHSDVYHHHKRTSYLQGLFELLSLVVTKGKSDYEPMTSEEALKRTKTVLDTFSSDDLLLHKRPNYEQQAMEFNSIIETLTSDDIYTVEFDHYISQLTKIHQDLVPSLKRLCRMEIRVNISTKYGMERQSGFDLRDLCTELPIPDELQKYLMIKVPSYN